MNNLIPGARQGVRRHGIAIGEPKFNRSAQLSVRGVDLCDRDLRHGSYSRSSRIHRLSFGIRRLSLTKSAICQATALSVAYGNARPLGIVHPQPFAVVVAMVELVEIAMQMSQIGRAS